PIGCAVDFVCRLLHLKIISLKNPLQIGLCNKAILVCFELLIYFIGGAGSGFLAKLLGYGNFYIVLAIASVVSLILSQLIISKSQKTLRSEML
ncbi:hypothetical protein ACG904_13190, partial [Acinetobacter guillouiae]